MVLAAALHQTRHDNAWEHPEEDGVYLFAWDYPEYDQRMRAIAISARAWARDEGTELTLA